MQQNLKFVLILAGVLVHSAAGSTEEGASLSPLRPLHPPLTLHQLIQSQIELDFTLRTRLPESELQDVVRDAIEEANPEHEGLPEEHARRLTRDVIQVSRCLGIDPIIFTALIWRESNFKPGSVSETGAVGLTQMTWPGIREVLERTSAYGYRRLRYARNLFRKCAPSVYRNLPEKVTHDSIARMKSIISISTLDGMVFGAFLLKLNLAAIRRHSPHRIELYREALERYNGDPQVKTGFARDVLVTAKRLVRAPEVALNARGLTPSTPEL